MRKAGFNCQQLEGRSQLHDGEGWRDFLKRTHVLIVIYVKKVFAFAMFHSIKMEIGINILKFIIAFDRKD